MFFKIAGNIVSILNQLFHNIYTHGKINNLQKPQNKLNSTGFGIYKKRMSNNGVWSTNCIPQCVWKHVLSLKAISDPNFKNIISRLFMTNKTYFLGVLWLKTGINFQNISTILFVHLWWPSLYNFYKFGGNLQQVFFPALHTDRYFVKNTYLNSGDPKMGISTKNPFVLRSSYFLYINVYLKK